MSRLRRHPFGMTTRFRTAIVLTFALPEETLAPLVPSTLALERVDGLGFVAVALVDMARLRPTGLPAWLGSDAVFVGYRVFVRTRLDDGRVRRGLKVLRTDVDRMRLLLGTRLLTRYDSGLVHTRWQQRGDRDHIRVRSRWRGEELTVETARDEPARPPAGSPFASWDEARPFSGPLPWTLAPDRTGSSAVAVKGVRSTWDPRPVTVGVHTIGFFDRPGFHGVSPRLAAAFAVTDVEYSWRVGIEHAIRAPSAEAP